MTGTPSGTARVFAARRNLKEAAGKLLARRTRTARRGLRPSLVTLDEKKGQGGSPPIFERAKNRNDSALACHDCLPRLSDLPRCQRVLVDSLNPVCRPGK